MTRPSYLDLALEADFRRAADGQGDLRGEAGGWDLPAAAAAAMIKAGVPGAFMGQLLGAGDLALGQVDLVRGGLFQFGGPDRRWLLAVRELGVVVDVVAMAPHDADQWALLRGQADLLGMEWLWRATVGLERELRLFATPRAWLRGGGRGICVLDWTASALGHLRGLGPKVTLVVDPGAKTRLLGLLQHGGLPLVAEDRPQAARTISGEWRDAA